MSSVLFVSTPGLRSTGMSSARRNNADGSLDGLPAVCSCQDRLIKHCGLAHSHLHSHTQDCSDIVNGVLRRAILSVRHSNSADRIRLEHKSHAVLFGQEDQNTLFLNAQLLSRT
jgi:hypothetical protein